MSRNQSAWSEALQPLIANRTLSDALISLLRKGDLPSITSLLNAYKYDLHTQEIINRSAPAESRFAARKQAYDLIYGSCQQLSGPERSVFMALVGSGMGLQFETYTYNAEDYAQEFSSRLSDNDYVKEKQEIYNFFKDHPLFEAFRDDLRYLSDEKALSILAELWNSDHKKEFLFLYDELLQIKNRAQFKRDPQRTEETFAQKVTSYPDLELVVINVSRGTPQGNGVMSADMPDLKIIVSNKLKPMVFDSSPVSDESSEPDFWILTANKTYTKLKDYIKDSLSERYESLAFGPYHYTSNDDRSYPTAANVIAGLQNQLRIPQNFIISAQDRMRAEIDSIHNLALGKIYGLRFLKAKGWSDWAAALTLVNGGPSAANTIDYYRAAATLVTHGLSHAANFLYVRGKNDSDLTQIYEGFKDGMMNLYDQMKSLAESNEHETDALTHYEHEFGFHPDVLLFPISDRKRLAFKDIGDMMLANLCGNMMEHVYFEEITKKDESEKKQVAILADIPVMKIADLYIAAGDVTNFMRLKEYFENLYGEGNSRSKILSDKIRKAGYSVLPRYSIKPLNGLKFISIFEADGTMHIRTDRMAAFKTPDQIVKDESFTEAVAAFIVLRDIQLSNPSIEIQEAKAAQEKALKMFITEVSTAREVSSILNKENLSALDRAVFFRVIEELLPITVALEAFSAGIPPQQTADTTGSIAKGFDRVENPKTPSRFERIVRAIRSVGNLLNG